MYYICDHCHYVFSCAALPRRCPDCGDLAIRMANEEESADHLRLLKVVENDNWDDTVAQRRQESSRAPERQDELRPTHANPQQKTSWDFSSHKKQPVFIKDETIVLRPVRPNDAEFYADLRMHYSMMYLHLPDKHRFLRRRINHPEARALFFLFHRGICQYSPHRSAPPWRYGRTRDHYHCG